MKDLYANFSVIIPIRSYSLYLNKCINEIIKLSKSIEIIVVYDDESFPNDFNVDFNNHLKNQILLLKSSKKTISAKRNLGSKFSKKKYLAFIDSDAFPKETWLVNAFNILESKKYIYCIGGPNISPEGQSYIKSSVGAAQKSFLVAGKWHYHKKIGKSLFVDHIPSCNMIIRKDIYSNYNGMNESIYTGEDLDFCLKINDKGNRIYFDKETIVYHYDRSFKNYFLQKIFRGAGVMENISNVDFIKNLYLLLPMFFLLFIILGFVLLVYLPLSLITLLYLLSIFIYIVLCVIETIKYCNFKNFIFVFFLIFSGQLFIGLGTILKFLKIGPNNKYYKNN